MTVPALQNGHKAPYILYHHAYSICSIMVRYTLALRGARKAASDEMVVEERLVEIFKGEQLTEHFLCDVNPKGQVPVLCNPEVLRKPLPDSLDITLYIAERHPSILPADHRDQIVRLLRELHGINYFSLSFGSKPTAALGMKSAIEKLMEKPGLSERYQTALRFKLQVHEEEKIQGVDKQTVQEEVKKAEMLFSELEGLLDSDAGLWMFGLDTATALDANLVPFVARLRELGMGGLIPNSILGYADTAMAKPEWNGVMEGRKTMLGV